MRALKNNMEFLGGKKLSTSILADTPFLIFHSKSRSIILLLIILYIQIHCLLFSPLRDKHAYAHYIQFRDVCSVITNIHSKNTIIGGEKKKKENPTTTTENHKKKLYRSFPFSYGKAYIFWLCNWRNRLCNLCSFSETKLKRKN